jgi:hypothetical protein
MITAAALASWGWGPGAMVVPLVRGTPARRPRLVGLRPGPVAAGVQIINKSSHFSIRSFLHRDARSAARASEFRSVESHRVP